MSLSKHQLLLAGCLFLGLHMALGITNIHHFDGLLSSAGSPIGADFITYWAASHLSLSGDPAAAYDSVRLLEAERIIGPVVMKHTAWYYPPTYLLLLLPLALLPYFQAYLAFISFCGMAYLLALRRYLPGPEYLLLLLAFPAVLFNVTSGQNGLLTAALGATALYNLERRPNLSGICIGLLCIKPHLAILLPIILILARAWKVILVASITTTLFILFSWIIFGTDTWLAFFSGISKARHFLETDIPLERMPTVFAAVRQAGGGLQTAYWVHMLIAAIALLAMVKAWRHHADLGLRSAAAVAATLLISPYLFDYDLAWLVIPMIWLAIAGTRTGWLPGERLLLVAIWFSLLYPQMIALVMLGKMLQLGSTINLALLLIILRRQRLTSHSVTANP